MSEAVPIIPSLLAMLQSCGWVESEEVIAGVIVYTIKSPSGTTGRVYVSPMMEESEKSIEERFV